MKHLIARVLGWRRHELVRNILALYALKAVNQLLPLAVIPFLARVLGPTEWGRLAMAQALAMWGIIVVQYGFPLSGTRAIARARDHPAELGRILSGIVGAQAALGGLFVLVALGIYAGLPAFQEAPLLFGCAIAFALLHALVPGWYFMGQERMVLVAGVDGAVKLASLVAVLALVRAPGDAWKVLAIYAAASAVSAVLIFLLVLREVRLPRPRWTGAARALRAGLSLGLLGIVGTGLSAGSTMLLGGWLTPRHAAFFFAAEKLCQPLAWLLEPVNTALMPRLSRLIGSSPEQARRMAVWSLALMLTTGAVLAVAVAFASPLLVPLVFGDGYDAAVPVVQVMALIIPLIVANAALAGQWLIPHGLDRSLTLSVVAGAVVHIGLAVALITPYGAHGMAWAAVGGQATVLAGLILALRRRSLIAGGGPLGRATT